jgi:hypothetical protein
MKLATFLLLGVLSATWVGRGQSSPPGAIRASKDSARVHLEFEVDPVSAKPGTRVFAKLKLRNTSSSVVDLDDRSPELDFGVTVVDVSGREVPLTERGERMRTERSWTRSTVMHLRPGEEQRAELEISGVYKLTTPGTYYARASRGGILMEAEEDRGKSVEIARSSPVEFRIVAGDSSPTR